MFCTLICYAFSRCTAQTCRLDQYKFLRLLSHDTDLLRFKANFRLCIDEVYGSIDRNHFVDNVSEWNSFYDDMSPQDAELPSPWNVRLNDFQKMIVLRCVRPDKVSYLVDAWKKHC